MALTFKLEMRYFKMLMFKWGVQFVKLGKIGNYVDKKSFVRYVSTHLPIPNDWVYID